MYYERMMTDRTLIGVQVQIGPRFFNRVIQGSKRAKSANRGILSLGFGNGDSFLTGQRRIGAIQVATFLLFIQSGFRVSRVDCVIVVDSSFTHLLGKLGNLVIHFSLEVLDTNVLVDLGLRTCPLDLAIFRTGLVPSLEALGCKFLFLFRGQLTVLLFCIVSSVFNCPAFCLLPDVLSSEMLIVAFVLALEAVWWRI